VRTLRVIALFAPAIARASEQAVPVALLVSVGAVPVPAIIRGIINASAFVDAIPISVAIAISVAISISITATMAISVTISVAVAIPVPGKVRLTNQDAISFAVLVQATTTIVAVAARIPRAVIT